MCTLTFLLLAPFSTPPPYTYTSHSVDKNPCLFVEPAQVLIRKKARTQPTPTTLTTRYFFRVQRTGMHPTVLKNERQIGLNTNAQRRKLPWCNLQDCVLG